MWRLTEKPRTLKVTRRLAEEFRDATPAPGDRPISRPRVARLRLLVASGQTLTFDWATAQCDDATYRVNGQHSSTVLAELEEIPEHCYACVSRYSCDELEDVAELYSMFDSRASARTTRDINRTYAATCTDLDGVASRILDKIVAGLAYEKWGSNKVTPQDRAALALDNVDYALWVVDLIGARSEGEDARLLARAPVMAAMARTYSKSKRAATEFWTLVRDASGPDPKSPDRVLSRYLNRHSVNYGGGARRGGSVDRREMFVKCLHAWNAWRQGSSTGLKYYPQAQTPKVL